MLSEFYCSDVSSRSHFWDLDGATPAVAIIARQSMFEIVTEWATATGEWQALSCRQGVSEGVPKRQAQDGSFGALQPPATTLPRRFLSLLLRAVGLAFFGEPRCGSGPEAVKRLNPTHATKISPTNPYTHFMSRRAGVFQRAAMQLGAGGQWFKTTRPDHFLNSGLSHRHIPLSFSRRVCPNCGIVLGRDVYSAEPESHKNLV